MYAQALPAAINSYRALSLPSRSQFCPLKKLTKEKYKITIIRFHKCDTSVYSTVDVIKTALMMFDANYISYDYGEDGFPEGEIFLLDVVGFAFKQFLDVSYNVKTLIAYAKYLQEAAPVNLKFNHIANTSSVLDGVMSLLKPILRKDIAETVQFHKHGSESLLNFIEADVLPIDYGGTNGYIDDHFKEWLAVFQTRRFVRLTSRSLIDLIPIFLSHNFSTESTCSMMTNGKFPRTLNQLRIDFCY